MDTTCCMTGRLGTPVDRRTAKNGAAYAHFRLASTPRVQRGGEWTDGATTWVSVRCYRALAENAVASLHKGDPVLVVGKLRTECWTDDQGRPRESIVLEAATIGHDLSVGNSQFSKPKRRSDPVAGDRAAEPGAGAQLPADARSTTATRGTPLDDGGAPDR